MFVYDLQNVQGKKKEEVDRRRGEEEITLKRMNRNGLCADDLPRLLDT